jgi:hypothetical protein
LGNQQRTVTGNGQDAGAVGVVAPPPIMPWAETNAGMSIAKARFAKGEVLFTMNLPFCGGELGTYESQD